MPIARVATRAAKGVEAPQVLVEAHLSNGLPAFNLVGLPEASVKEARERVRSAIINAGFEFPMRRITINFLLMAIICSLSNIGVCDELTSYRVIDGDSLKVISEQYQQPITIRLAGIDCPEIDQPWGINATDALSHILGGTEKLSMVTDSTDRYGRPVVTLKRGELNLNLWLIESGNCWCYPRYSKGTDYCSAQEKARANKLGLWRKEVPIPPWNWRK